MINCLNGVSRSYTNQPKSVILARENLISAWKITVMEPVSAKSSSRSKERRFKGSQLNPWKARHYKVSVNDGTSRMIIAAVSGNVDMQPPCMYIIG